MPKFFFFLKNKKKLFISLFATFLGLATPAHAHAVVLGFVVKAAAWIGGAALAFLGLKSAVGDIMDALFRWSGNILHAIAVASASLAFDFFETAINITSQKTILKNDVFYQGWAQIRNLSNMFIVLGFVVIGIAFALRIENYGSKKLLISLILIAVLINFSGLFVGLIIDASNIVFKGLLPAGGAGNINDNIFSFMTKMDGDMWESSAYKKAESKEQIILIWQMVVFWAIIAITFFHLAILFLVRYAMLAILYILAPLAFFCWVFPATKKLWTQWWNNFIKWAFVGVIGAFFVYISARLLNQIVLNQQIQNQGGIDQYGLIVVLIFLYVGYRITKSSSAMGAGAVIGLASGAAGYALGKVKGAGKVAGKAAWHGSGAAGITNRAGAAAKDKVTAVGERLGLVNKGATAKNRANRLKEPMADLEHISDNAQLAKIAEQRTVTQKQRLDKAAAATILNKRNAFDTVDPAKQQAVAAHAVAMGASKEDFVKNNPEVFSSVPTTKTKPNVVTRTAQGAKDVVTKTAEKIPFVKRKITPGTTTANQTSRLEKQLDEDAIEKVQTDKAIYDIESAGLNRRSAAAQKIIKDKKKQNVSQSEIKKARADIRQKNIIESAMGISALSDKEVTNKIITDRRDNFVRGGATPEMALSRAKAQKVTTAEMVIARKKISQEKIQKRFAKLSTPDIVNLPDQAFSSADFGKYVAPQVLSRAIPRLPAKKGDQVKKLAPVLGAQIRSDLGLPANVNMGQTRSEIARLKNTGIAADLEKANTAEIAMANLSRIRNFIKTNK